MTQEVTTVEELVELLLKVPIQGRRRLIALSGPPASGKSTLSDELARILTAKDIICAVVPMDGFHLPNQTLVEAGLLDRKGAPETFDAAGFLTLIEKLQSCEEVDFPTFDRKRDVTIPEGDRVAADCDTVIVEGNYLLFDAPVWRDLRQHWDWAVALYVPDEVLKGRLLDRWLRLGLTPEIAEQRAEQNDLRNARAVAQSMLAPDALYRAPTSEP